MTNWAGRMRTSLHVELFLTGCREEAGAVLDRLSQTTLMRLALTCRSAYVSVQRCVAYRLRRKMEEFDLDYDGLLVTLRRTQAIIVGSFPLVCLLPIAYRAEVVDNIDFITPMSSFHDTVREITGNTRYRKCEPQHAPIQRNRLVRGIESYRIHTKEGPRFLNFHMSDDRSNELLLESIFYSSTTLTMNAITGWGIFCAYADLLERNGGLRNDPTRMKRFNKNVPPEGRHDFELDNIRQTKLEDREFTFPKRSEGRSEHNMHGVLGRCRESPSCPDTIRSVRDRGCRFQMLMTKGEVSELEHHLFAEWPVVIGRPELPETIWRITNGEELGAMGFVMTIESED